MPMKYKQGAQKVKPQLLAPPNVFLEDIWTRYKTILQRSLKQANWCSTNTEKPISCGLYRLEAGKELVYPYDYDEMKIVLEGNCARMKVGWHQGEFEITDETGYKVTAKPGDVFYFEKGRRTDLKHC